jgi:DNA-binding MarR family transcriptional regulator
MKHSAIDPETNMAYISTYQSGVAQATAHRVINRVVSEYLEQYKLSAMQWFIIGHIYDAGTAGITLGDLRFLIGNTLPYMTNTITILEAKDMIIKKNDEKDARIKVVTIHPKSAKLIQKIESGLRDELRKTLYSENNISRDELQTYISVLYKIINS